MPRVRGMHGQRLDNAVERVEGVVARVLRGIARTIASLVGASPSTAALSDDDLQPIRQVWEKAVGEDIVPVVAEAFAESARTLGGEFAAAGREVAPLTLDAPEAADFLDAATNRLVGVSDTLWEIARGELADGVRAGDGVEELAARLQEAGGFGIARARMIARTEVVAASNAASLAQALRLGDPSMTKTWDDSDDTRVRAAHEDAAGQTVPVDEPFEVGGEWLMYPGQPIGSPSNIINERCTLTYSFGDNEEPLVAAAEVHTGAMVALRPSVEDARRLAVDGGEPADQLHATLAYLGAAADISDDAQARIIEAIFDAAERMPGPLTVEGFAVSAFNPGETNDRDPCVVLGLSGEGLDDVHGHAMETLGNLQSEPAGFTLPEQHSPWQPHVTLIYTDDVSMVEQLADKVGPVTFDAIRVAFGGETFDIPLGEPAPEDEGGEDGDDFDWDSYLAQAIQAQFQSRMSPQLQAHWIRKLRLGAPGSFRKCVRELREYFPEDTEGLCANLYKTATGRWPSEKKDNALLSGADAPVVELPEAALAVDVASEPSTPDPLAALPGEHFHTWTIEGVSTGLRLFAPGAITWRTPPFAFHDQVKSSAHGGVPETIHTGIVTRAERIGNEVHFWGRLDLRHPVALDQGRRIVEGFNRWSSVGADESIKDANIDVEYVLPDGDVSRDSEPEVDLMTFRQYRVAEITGVSVPALADALLEPTPELIATLTDMGVIDPTPQAGTEPPEETPEDTMGDTPAVHDTPAVVVAAGHTITLPEAPPAAWFDEPDDDELPPYGSVRVDAQGRLIGLLAPAEVNHRSFPGKRVKVPMGNVDYSGWQNKPHDVAEGHSINVGVITMNCGHASTSPGDWSYTNRREHYDNTCSIAAHARAYEKPGIGVALAGAIAPWLDAEGFGKLLSSDLSGDWPPHPDKPGWRDFIAALAVPVGGFANRARLRVADGALVAAAVPVQFDDMEIPMEMEEAPLLVEGTRVRVLDPRDPEVAEGEIAVVHTGPAYALLVPGRDDPVRWYVAEELAPAETAPDEPVAEPVEVEEIVASGGPDLRPVMEVMARSVGRDSASRMAALRNRVHRTD